MNNINWNAIHAAAKDHGGNLSSAQPAVPQPQQNSPMHKMAIHAMAMTPNKDGESPQTMLLRALTEHLKRITPDVSSIHKDQAQPATR